MKPNNKVIKNSLFTATTIALLLVTACTLNNQTKNTVNAAEIVNKGQINRTLAKNQNSSPSVK